MPKCIRCGKTCADGENMCDDCKAWFREKTGGELPNKRVKLKKDNISENVKLNSEDSAPDKLEIKYVKPYEQVSSNNYEGNGLNGGRKNNRRVIMIALIVAAILIFAGIVVMTGLIMANLNNSDTTYDYVEEDRSASASDSDNQKDSDKVETSASDSDNQKDSDKVETSTSDSDNQKDSDKAETSNGLVGNLYTTVRGATFELPEGFTMYDKTEMSDYYEYFFVNEDLKMELYVQETTSEQSVFENNYNSYMNGDVVYNVKKDDWFVVSGYISYEPNKRDEIFYRKEYFESPIIYSFEFAYPTANSDICDNIVEDFEDSYSINK